MRHLSKKIVLLTSFASSVCTLQAEAESVTPADAECTEPTVLERLFSTEKFVDCSAAAKNARRANRLDDTYLSTQQGDDMYRIATQRILASESRTENSSKSSGETQPLAEFKNVTSSNPNSTKSVIDTVDGYLTIDPSDQ